MSLKLPATFRFSIKITLFAVIVILISLRSSWWQWTRYLEKTALIATYQENSVSPVTRFPLQGTSPEEFAPYINRKVRVRGKYDFNHQMIVMNRIHASGPGYWLLTPLKIEGRPESIIVSRGFIPYSESSSESWSKYNFTETEEFDAVVQPGIRPLSFLSPANPDVGPGLPWVSKWKYPETEKIAAQLPYPLLTAVYLQRVGGPPTGTFPAESISIQVPPSTHFGYTIEWCLIALVTGVIAFLLQAFPRTRKQS